jgi:hypothetical protein
MPVNNRAVFLTVPAWDATCNCTVRRKCMTIRII